MLYLSVVGVLSFLYLTCTGEPLGITPFGLFPKQCIHSVKSGSHVLNERDHIVVTHPDFPEQVTKIPRCDKRLHSQKKDDKAVVDGDGWQQYVKYQTDNITQFLGKWTVPEAPSQFGEGVLFTFTGLQNIDWVPPSPEPSGQFDIIQPVLQYGFSAAGGGAYWTIASWYVTLGLDVVYSELKRVNSNVVIFGNMTKTGNDTWFINTVDTSANVQTAITVSRSVLQSQPWAYITLEVYDIFTCNDYPSDSIPYTNLQLFVEGRQVSPQWVVGTNGQNPPICDSSISIENPNTVSINFK